MALEDELRARIRTQPLLSAFRRAVEAVAPELAARLDEAEEHEPDHRMPAFLDALDREYAALTERKAPVEVEGLVERNRKLAMDLCGSPLEEAAPVCLIFDQNADALQSQATELATLKQQLAEAVEHINEQATFAESRIQDGKDMGASVWRIALEDVARENRALTQKAGAQ